MNKVLVIGGANRDYICKSNTSLALRDSNIGANMMSLGGVGRNICENLSRLGLNVSFISAVGNDEAGKTVLENLHSINVDTTHVVTDASRTGSYIAFLDDDNDMYIAMCDNEAVSNLNVDFFKDKMDYINSFNYVVVDSNFNDEVFDFLLENVKGKIFTDATSCAKAVKLRRYLNRLAFIKCNIQEANAILGTENLKSHELLNRFIELGVKQVVITSGAGPIYYNKEDTIYTVDIIKVPQELVKSTTGCGDAFMSGMIYGIVNNMTIHACVNVARRVAAKTIQVVQACNPDLKIE